MADSRGKILADSLVTAKTFIGRVRKLSDPMPDRLTEEVDLFEYEIKLLEARMRFLDAISAPVTTKSQQRAGGGQ